MIRLFMGVAAICLAACRLVPGADIDGKWSTETTTRGKDKSKEMTVRTTFNLKADGAKLSGTATMEANGRSRDLPVQDGKIDGNKFSFTTVQKGRAEDGRAPKGDAIHRKEAIGAGFARRMKPHRSGPHQGKGCSC